MFLQSAQCCCFCSIATLQEEKISPCATCAYRVSNYKDRLENAKKTRNVSVALMRSQRSTDVADIRLLFDILYQHQKPEDAEMTLPFRSFLASTAEGVQTLLSGEGQRWLHKLGGVLDYTGIPNLEELASLQPLADAGHSGICEIKLSDCKRLKTLGSMEAIIDLRSIARLSIDGCPELLFPPREIAAKDGAAVVTFLRHRIMDLHATSLIGKELPLFGAMKRCGTTRPSVPSRLAQSTIP